MTMEKRNVVEEKRTPEHERARKDEHWDKEVADVFALGRQVGKTRSVTEAMKSACKPQRA